MENEVIDLYSAIISINEKWEEKFGLNNVHEFPRLGVSVSGYSWGFSIDETYLFSSENNERKFIEGINEYEPWEKYIKREINQYIKKLSKFKI